MTDLVEAELLGALSEYEEHGVNDVRLATAVRTHHRRESLQNTFTTLKSTATGVPHILARRHTPSDACMHRPASEAKISLWSTSDRMFGQQACFSQERGNALEPLQCKHGTGPER
jgi:hypothetical protein